MKMKRSPASFALWLLVASAAVLGCSASPQGPAESPGVVVPSEAPSPVLGSAKEFISLGFGPVASRVDISDAAVDALLPYGADAAHLVPVFVVSGKRVLVNGVPQASGVTENDFSAGPLDYVVEAEDGTTRTYAVSVTIDAERPYLNLADIQYAGTGVRNRMDVSLPAGRFFDAPVIVMMHGGYWIGGSKADFGEAYRKLFTDRGYACVSINYRYANEAGVNFEEIMDDVRSALRSISARSEEWRIAPDRFALLGFSAGAVNAALYGHRFDQDGCVRAIVCFSGAYDFTDEGLWASADDDRLLDFVGDTSRNADASALFGIRDVPTLLFHGEFDSIIPEAHAQAFADAMEAAGARRSYVMIPDSGHGFDFAEAGRLQTINDWLDAFLK